MPDMRVIERSNHMPSERSDGSLSQRIQNRRGDPPGRPYAKLAVMARPSFRAKRGGVASLP